MSMSDPIADMLTRLRNAIQAKQPTVDVPASRIKEDICAVLKQEGFISGFIVTAPTGDPKAMLRVSLRYAPDQTPVIQGLRRISKPSLRRYARVKELRMVRSGMGIAILSTPQGVMTNKQARAAKVGGEVLCEIW